MTDINIISAELGVLLDKPFDNPFQYTLNSMLLGYRATILKQEFDKNGRYPSGTNQQTLVLPLINVSASECCCSDDCECTVRRTKDKVPMPIRGNFKPEPFLYVGNSNMGAAFTYARVNEIENILRYSKFIRNEAYYDYYNEYIYVFNFPGNKLGVRDAFSNPSELLSLKSCSGQMCADTIMIEDDMKKVLKQMVLEEFGVVKKIIEDIDTRINEND